MEVRTDDLVLGDETEVEKAKRLVETDRAKREAACTAEIQAAMKPILEKYRCDLKPTLVMHRGMMTVARIESVAVD